MRHSLSTLPWWPAWQASAKTACPWLSSAGQRVRLQALLRLADLQPDDLAAKLANLFHGAGRFV